MKRQENLHKLIIMPKRDKPILTFFPPLLFHQSPPSRPLMITTLERRDITLLGHHTLTWHGRLWPLREAANVRFSQLEISRRLCSICSSAEPIQILTSHSEACARKPPYARVRGDQRATSVFVFCAWHRLRPPAERVVILIRSFVLTPASHVHLPNTLI